MDKILVQVFPDNTKVVGYRYAESVVLILSGKIRDTDQSIATDSEGFRYKRYLYPGCSGSLFAEYRRI